MSLEDAMNKLADAMNRYADVIEKVGLGVTSGTLPAASATAASGASEPATPAAESTGKGKGRGAGKNKPEPAATSNNEPDPLDEEDPFGGSEPAARAYTADDIRTLVGWVKEEKGRDEAIKIIKSTGAATLGQIDEKDYAKVAEQCIKLGAKL